MEELLALVPDKDISDYLKEAFRCYGTGAYRACIVLTNIALFEDLRRKVKKLAPVNSVAKSVSEEIEPLAEAQKVFETPLIQRMRKASLLTELEAQILTEINSHRNKAAHPSGHEVSAEEARYVFSESIRKFASQPVRETSYVIDQILSRIEDKNFFPSRILSQMENIVSDEMSNLDDLAIPFLIARLTNARIDGVKSAQINAQSFFSVLASKKDKGIRSSLLKEFIDKYATNTDYNQSITELITCDPLLLKEAKLATRQRLLALVIRFSKDAKLTSPYRLFKNPAHLFCSCMADLGEEFMLTEMKDFTDWIISETPYYHQFVTNIGPYKKILKRVITKYVENASSRDHNISDRFAKAVPDLDVALSDVISDEEAFRLIAAICSGAEWRGLETSSLVSDKFSAIPQLRIKGKDFSHENETLGAKILKVQNLSIEYDNFNSDYLE